MATKLGLFNGSLAILKERKLATLTDNTPSRHALDLIYDDTVAYMIEQGLWNFAQRSVLIDPDPDVTTPFGYRNAFEHPSDMVRLTKISASERFYPALNEFLDEGAHFFADVSVLYLMYVSNGASYGLDLTRWPATFTRAVEFELAVRAGPSIGASAAAIDDAKKDRKLALMDARSKDALRQPSDQMQPGRLVTARHYGRTSGRGLWD